MILESLFRFFCGFAFQCVALTGPNTTGPPRAAPGELPLHMRVLQTATDASDRY